MIYCIVIFAAFSVALYGTCSSKLMKSEPCLSPLRVLFLTHLVALLFLTPCWLGLYYCGAIHVPNQKVFWFAVIVSAVLSLMSKWAQFYGLAKLDVALVSSFSALTPVFAILAGWSVLHEIPSFQGLIGILIITASLYWLFLKERGEASLATWVVSPLTTIWRNQALALCFLSALLPAFGIAYQRQAMLFGDAFTYSLVVIIFITAGTFSLLSVGLSREDHIGSIRQIDWWTLIFAGLCFAISLLLFSYAATFLLAAYLSALNRVSILFHTALGYYILQEHSDTKKRGLVSLFLLIGFFTIALGEQ